MILQSIEGFPHKGKTTTEDIPRLAFYSGSIMSELPEGTLRLSKIRPKGLTVDKPFRISMMAPTQYLLAYVQEIAKKDVEKARFISELVEVPVVKRLEGESKYVVEKRRLSAVILEETARIGEEAGRELSKIMLPAKAKTRKA